MSHIRKEIESKSFLNLGKNEFVINEFRDAKKTRWKTFGNKSTDFAVVTNKKLIHVVLVREDIFYRNHEYMVNYIPFDQILQVERFWFEDDRFWVTKKLGCKITYKALDREAYRLIQLKNNTNYFIDLIKGLLKESHFNSNI
ncbi:MAG: hypothetical protein JXR05_14450 [Flavobacteriaceae bacterium]